MYTKYIYTNDRMKTLVLQDSLQVDTNLKGKSNKLSVEFN